MSTLVIVKRLLSALSYVSQPHFFAIVHTGDSDFALTDKVVSVDVVHQATVGCRCTWRIEKITIYRNAFGGLAEYGTHN